MVKSNDGFYLSEVDLKLRGPGDLQGTQQSGILNLKIADIVKDERILKLARNDAKDLLSNDPMLNQDANAMIKKHYLENYKKNINWGQIS